MTKQILTLFCIVCLTGSAALATKYTVSNNPATRAQFDTFNTINPLIEAVDSAQVGDTLYVHASPAAYSALTLSKKLILIGAGWNPYGVDQAYDARIGKITLSENSDGSILDGFLFDPANQNSAIIAGGADSVIVRNCGFKYDGYTQEYGIDFRNFGSNNWQIVNCFFNGNYWTYDRFALIESDDINIRYDNCIFYRIRVDGFDDNTVGIEFNHCAFLPGSFAPAGFLNCRDFTIRNSIFLNEISECTNCTFINNISYNCDTSCDFAINGSTEIGNLENTNPMFIQNPGTTFTPSINIGLQLLSPGHNAASDIGDIGVFGGYYPFVFETNYAGAPHIPQILNNFFISNSSVTTGGTIQINGSVENGE